MNCQTLQNAAGQRPPPQLPAAQTMQAAAFARSVGATHFSYLLLQAPANARITGALQSSYPAEWVARYCARGYLRLDPAVLTARQARLPFRWGHGAFLRRYAKVERRVFHEAREFQVTEGWAVPVFGPDGEAAIFSVCAPHVRDMEDIVADHSARIRLFAVEFHDAVMGGLSRQPSAGRALSPREREVLGWAADGLTTDEIAERLALTASAINYHLGNAARKLGARNKYHAAIVALRKGLI